MCKRTSQVQTDALPNVPLEAHRLALCERPDAKIRNLAARSRALELGQSRTGVVLERNARGGARDGSDAPIP